jgi:hypothetical protein
MMRNLSALAMDALNDGTMLGRYVVKLDRAHLEDIGLEAAAKIGGDARRCRRILGRRRAARLLDGIVLFHRKLKHARAHPQHHERELRRLCIRFLPYGTKMLTRGGHDSTC